MSPPQPADLPEVFIADDPKWASRATRRGEIRRLARGLYSSNLDEPVEQLLRRRWADVAALYFPGAVVVDRSAIVAGPARDGSLFLDTGPTPVRPRSVVLPGLTLRPRSGPGRIEGDMPFVGLWMASPARTYLDNMRPSRARSGIRRTLSRDELEEKLDQVARAHGDAVLNEIRDAARAAAPLLEADDLFEQLDRLIGALQGTREGDLVTPAARARGAGLAYDTDRLKLFEMLRAQLAQQELPRRPEPPDPERLFAFFEAYFSNWIEGTEFEVEEAAEIVFERRIPVDRPDDAHDVQGTFDLITDPKVRAAEPADFDQLEALIGVMHRRVMRARPEVRPGAYKRVPNRAGNTSFVHPDLVRGTLREGFSLCRTLPPGLPRAIYAMFLVAEVHPFADGNGRVARALMNAELSAAGLCRVMIPLSYRDEYLNALRALSRNENPRPLWRMVDRAQSWASKMTWAGRDRVFALMGETNALADPRDVDDRDLHLLDP